MTKPDYFSIKLIFIITVGLIIHFNGFSYSQTPGTLYGSTGNVGATLITIDPVTGTGTSIGSLGTFGPVTEIEFREDGVLFGSTGQLTSNIIKIDPLNGVESLIGMHQFGATNGLEFDSNNNLLGSYFNPNISVDLVLIDQSTGQFITTFGVIGSMTITALTFHPNGTLYGVGHNGGGTPSQLYTIDPAAGVPTLIGPIGFNNVGALEFGPDGVLYGGVGIFGGSSAGYLITIDPNTGVGTSVGPTGFSGISGLSFVPEILPVELTSFSANVSNEGDVFLKWSTATEVNNQMFEIERRSQEGQYVRVGFVNGHGTTSETQEYSYINKSVEMGTYFYRLKQIDFNGTYEYSDEIEVEVNGTLTFALEQNFPNPFNPTTTIQFESKQSGRTVLKIYDVLSKEVDRLIDEKLSAGSYKVTFEAKSLPSGMYFYTLESSGMIQVKKMILIK